MPSRMTFTEAVVSSSSPPRPWVSLGMYSDVEAKANGWTLISDVSKWKIDLFLLEHLNGREYAYLAAPSRMAEVAFAMRPDCTLCETLEGKLFAWPTKHLELPIKTYFVGWL